MSYEIVFFFFSTTNEIATSHPILTGMTLHKESFFMEEFDMLNLTCEVKKCIQGAEPGKFPGGYSPIGQILKALNWCKQCSLWWMNNNHSIECRNRAVLPSDKNWEIQLLKLPPVNLSDMIWSIFLLLWWERNYRLSDRQVDVARAHEVFRVICALQFHQHPSNRIHQCKLFVLLWQSQSISISFECV